MQTGAYRLCCSSNTLYLNPKYSFFERGNESNFSFVFFFFYHRTTFWLWYFFVLFWQTRGDVGRGTWDALLLHQSWFASHLLLFLFPLHSNLIRLYRNLECLCPQTWNKIIEIQCSPQSNFFYIISSCLVVLSTFRHILFIFSPGRDFHGARSAVRWWPHEAGRTTRTAGAQGRSFHCHGCDRALLWFPKVTADFF